MEEIRDRELNVVGERYRSFTEFFRVNDRRQLNALYRAAGDGAAAGMFEVDAGTVFSPRDTRDALLGGTRMFDERFEQARTRAETLLRERYEWREEPRSKTDVRGQHVIVERFAAGHPEAFQRRRSDLRRKRSVEIVYDAMCPASTSVSKRIEAGCTVLAAVEALERMGYEVAVTFALAKYSGAVVAKDPILLLEVPLKGFGERLVAGRLQFPLAGKSMLFHVGCWWARRFGRTPLDYGEGEGYPLSYDKSRVRAMERYAARRGGSYLSEDIVELQLRMDPEKVLERVLGDIGAGDELAVHMRAKVPMSAVTPPEQGKLFAGWDPGEGEGAARGACGTGGEDGDGGDGAQAGEPSDNGGQPEAASAETSQPAEPDDEGDAQPEAAGKDDVLLPAAGEDDAGPGAEGEGGAARQDASDEDDGAQLGTPGEGEAFDDAEGGGSGASVAGVGADSPVGARPLVPVNSCGESDAARGRFDVSRRLVDDRQPGATYAGAREYAPTGDSAPSNGSGAPGIGGRGNDGPGYGNAPAPSEDTTAERSPADETAADAGDAPGSGGAGTASSPPDDGTPPGAPLGDGSLDGEGEAGDSGGAADDGAEGGEPSDEEGTGAMADDEVTGISPVQEQEEEPVMENEMVDDPFIVALRKRYVRFEQGEYLQQMIDEKMARKKAAKAAAGIPMVPPAPVAPPEGAPAPKTGVFRTSPLAVAYMPQS